MHFGLHDGMRRDEKKIKKKKHILKDDQVEIK